MKTRRDKLKANVFLHHVLLKDLRGFVVYLLEFGWSPRDFRREITR
jgi:hypothetical protein